MATQKRIGLNGENPLYSADPSGTYYFAVRDAAGNIGVSTVEAQFTWVRGAANYSTGWKSIPNTNGYTYFAISYNHTSNCMYAIMAVLHYQLQMPVCVIWWLMVATQM